MNGSILMGIFILVFIIALIFRSRANKKVRERERIEREQAAKCPYKVEPRAKTEEAREGAINQRPDTEA
jgi:hypothetical protein